MLKLHVHLVFVRLPLVGFLSYGALEVVAVLLLL